MKKYFVNINEVWKGPCNPFSMIFKIVFKQIKYNTTIWHEGVCVSNPPVSDPKDCSHGTIECCEDSFLSWMFPKEKIKRVDNPLIAYTKYGLERV